MSERVKLTALIVTDVKAGDMVKINPFQQVDVKYMNPSLNDPANHIDMFHSKVFEGERRVACIKKECWIQLAGGLHYARQSLLVKGIDY